MAGINTVGIIDQFNFPNLTQPLRAPTRDTPAQNVIDTLRLDPAERGAIQQAERLSGQLDPVGLSLRSNIVQDVLPRVGLVSGARLPFEQDLLGAAPILKDNDTVGTRLDITA